MGALSIASCSVVLDWNGYTGGSAAGDPDSGDSSQSDPGDVVGVDGAQDVGQDTEPEAGQDVGADVGAPDATLGCGPATCGGCCKSDGFCAGGESTATCGIAGATCLNCANMGLGCSEGACSAEAGAPLEGGPPPACDVTTCLRTVSCFPGLQTSCCRTDGTCGCAVINYPMLNDPMQCM
jgi:hypothetical protein